MRPHGAGDNNGIAYVTAADLDGDHITDYVYAGDIKGNVWRFDLTSSDPANWAAGPRTIQHRRAADHDPAFGRFGHHQLGRPSLMVEFGTGEVRRSPTPRRPRMPPEARVCMESGTGT